MEVTWDEIVDDNSRHMWRVWKHNAASLSEVEVERRFSHHDSPIVDIQLHIFADASELVYGTVAYLCFSYKVYTSVHL